MHCRYIQVLIPGSIYLVNASTHESAIGAEEKSNNVRSLFDSTLPLKGCRFIEGGIAGPSPIIPLLLHQRRVDGSRGHAVDTNLTLSVLLSSRLCKPYDTMFAGIVGAMPGKSYSSMLEPILRGDLI